MPRKLVHLCPRCLELQAKDAARRNKIRRWKKRNRTCMYGGCNDPAVKGAKGRWVHCQTHLDYFKEYGQKRRDVLGLKRKRREAKGV